MKALGYTLISVGFVIAAYFTSLHPTEVNLPPYLGALTTAILGVAIVRYTAHKAAHHIEHIQASIETISKSLRSIAEKTNALDRGKEDFNVYDLRFEIERELPADIHAFVESRESIAHSYGLQAYAEVMNEFAAGERYLNRVWSASTDGYIDEAHTYLGKASFQFEAAVAKLETLGA